MNTFALSVFGRLGVIKRNPLQVPDVNTLWLNLWYTVRLYTSKLHLVQVFKIQHKFFNHPLTL